MKEGKRVKERVRRYKRRRKKGNKKSTLKKMRREWCIGSGRTQYHENKKSLCSRNGSDNISLTSSSSKPRKKVRITK